MPERVHQMAGALAAHLTRLAERSRRRAAAGAGAGAGAAQEPAVADAPGVDALLAGIHVYRCFDHVEQVALLHDLPAALRRLPKVRRLHV